MAKKTGIWFLKAVAAGVTAFVILSLFCVLYYNPPVHTAAADGATGYTRMSDTFWARGTEGFAMGRTDERGYNNSYPADGRDVSILMMGSSQTEGLYVNEDACASYLLNEYFAADGSRRYVYNIGMSAHTIYRNVSNLETALELYAPADYVALETGVLSYDSLELQQALGHTMPELPTGTGYPLLDALQTNPYLKLLYQQLSNYRNQETDGSASGEGYDVLSPETVPVDEQLLGYVAQTARAYGCQAIIYYIPEMQLDEDGELLFAATGTTREQYARLCREHGILFVDMTDRVKELYEQEHVLPCGFANTGLDYGHLNEEGHRLLADAIYDAVMEKEAAAEENTAAGQEDRK